MGQAPAKMARAKTVALALAASLILAACSGNGPGFPGLSATDGASSTSAETSASGSPYPDAAAGAKPVGDAPISPFGHIPDPSQGGRQVIQNPTIAEIMATGPLPEMAIGRQDAPVTIVQYASLTCPHCRSFHQTTFPELQRTYIKTGKVRFILREFPIGKQSGNATIALRCAPPDKYFELYGKFMDQQNAWVSQEVRLEPIFAVAKQVGMTQSQFDACLKNQAMIDGLKWVKERGRTLGIIGTPMFFVQGKLVKKTLTMSEIRELVEPLLAAPQASAAGAVRTP
ncbi:MAG: DsbA family protein [Hyphomicrobium zavarzinii]|jgi:protein-disulfide isomerase|uniref:DsbA family protein n=1 Tax=Hyphomicrobium TaxID=81 RepID=UPI001A37AA6C|nr:MULTISPECIES: DsbA family protein [Hyphomicrobium]MBL8844167.1 DsbA family protein [Hyphomicrobium zavarzinii]WBT39468.1 DsbA family protein [Hyphomicrobium sp. DMF-1]HML43482.1 DsbA family protein [Hyphomicrobium zavarzinii]